MEIAHLWASVANPELEIVARPLSDGGDGFIDVVRHYQPRMLEVRTRVRDALGRPIDARWGWDPERATAYIESAAAIGLARLGPAERAPLEADSFGVGQLVTSATRLGADRLVIGLGGSATVDAGFGMARALGYRFEGRHGESIERTAELPKLREIVPPEVQSGRSRVIALADVTNPLLGPSGAASVFGPQKGADRAAIERLEAGLMTLAERWVADLGTITELSSTLGAGAAGGLGAGCQAFLGADVDFGASWCSRLAELEKALDDGHAVVTGEGRFDEQSTAGKVTGYVLSEADRRGLPAGVVCAASTVTEAPPGVTVVTGQHLRKSGGDTVLSESDVVELFRIAVEKLRF